MEMVEEYVMGRLVVVIMVLLCTLLSRVIVSRMIILLS